MAALHSTQNQILVAEVSSFQLEWTPTFRPRAAAITSLSPDHLDRYNSYEHYVQTKYKIFANQTDDDIAVVTDTEPFTTKAEKKLVLPDGSPNASAMLENGWLKLEHGKVQESEFRILGTHNHLNIAIALTLVRPFLDNSEMGLAIQALKEFPGLGHRRDFVAENSGIRSTSSSAVSTKISAFET